MGEQLSLQLARNKVVKHNAFIEARYDWTAMMHRIIAVLIGQIRKDDTRFGTQRVYLTDIIQLSEVDGRGIYDGLEEACERLRTAYIEIPEEGEGWRRRNVMSEVAYKGRQGYIEARFNQDMRPFLLQLKTHFTQYVLRQVMVFSSTYSIRFYEMCARWADTDGFFDVSVEQLRAMLGLEDKYSRVTDLKTRVIDAARAELMERADLYFDYTEIRSGRKLVGFKFQVQRQARKKKLPPPPKRIVVNGTMTPEEEAELQERKDIQARISAMPQAAQEALRERATERAEQTYPKLGEWSEPVRESMIVEYMLQLVQDESAA